MRLNAMINEFDKLIDNYNWRTCILSDSRNAIATNFEIEIMEENLRDYKKSLAWSLFMRSIWIFAMIGASISLSILFSALKRKRKYLLLTVIRASGRLPLVREISWNITRLTLIVLSWHVLLHSKNNAPSVSLSYTRRNIYLAVKWRQKLQKIVSINECY